MDILDQNIAEAKKVKQDKDVKSRDGTQPKKYFDKKGDDKLAKSTKQDRARHFEKGAKMSDDNPDAYKPAPGDATGKTKPSKHTKKFKAMYGEAVSPAQQAAIAIAKRKSGKYDKDGKRLEKEACWDGYKKVGMKKKGDKMVPNCVPEMNEKNKDMTAISTWKKNLKKVKGLSKDTMQQLSMLPTPVITSLINQIGMIVAQYNEELEESYDVRKYMNLKKQLANLRIQADKAESGGRKDSLMGIQKRMDQIKDKMHKVKYEELGPNADAGDYIDDFRKSDAPQFKGKSDKKIRKMAIAAYLDSKEKK